MIDLASYLSHVQRCSLFSAVSPVRLTQLLSTAKLRQCHAGELVSSRDFPADGISLILSGTAKVILLDEAGHRKTLHFLTQEDVFFGEVSLFAGRTDAEVFAADDALSLLCFPRDEILQLVGEESSVALEFLKVMAHRVNDLRRQLNYLAHMRLEARVAVQLLRLAYKFGEALPAEPAVRITLPVTHQDLADLIGTNRETVTRIIGLFKKAGLVEASYKHIIIQDPARLEREWVDATT